MSGFDNPDDLGQQTNTHDPSGHPPESMPRARVELSPGAPPPPHQDPRPADAGSAPRDDGFVANLQDRLSDQVREHPYASLAAAAGLGYVAAAGVPTFVLRALFGHGVRLATGVVVGSLLKQD